MASGWAGKIVRNLFEFRMASRILLNNFLIATRLERHAKRINNRWMRFVYDPGKSLRENVGFAHNPDDEEALRKIHDDLRRVAQKYLAPGDHVLDIGCGTGLYLRDFGREVALAGLDISPGMIELVRRELPHVECLVGDFMQVKIERLFKLIYTISTLEFINRSDLGAFFGRAAGLLQPGGVLFIQYPHALSFLDTLYPKLKYIKYSPALVDRMARKHLRIVEHHHAFDGRVVQQYDPVEYPSRRGTFKNGYLLVAQKDA